LLIRPWPYQSDVLQEYCLKMKELFDVIDEAYQPQHLSTSPLNPYPHALRHGSLKQTQEQPEVKLCTQ
jgi:hypothetical protein